MNEVRIFLDGWAPEALSLLRIVTGFIFLQHGSQKLFAFPSASEGGKPSLTSLFGVAGLMEFIGGILILLGLFTRPVAFLLSGEMAVAYFMVHAPMGFWPLVNKGEVAALYCFIFLYLLFAGPGPWSLDAAFLGY